MTDSTTPGPARTCGACGARVAADAVTCPTCGAFLAAYETASGASAPPAVSDTSATHYTPSASMTAPASPAPTPPSSSMTPPTSPPSRPVSQSPIGDALRRNRLFSQPIPDPDETLTTLAGGDDALSEMAEGKDELAAMAAAGGETLAEQIDAQLARAKVKFDGGGSTIETSPKPEAKPDAEPAPTRSELGVGESRPRPGKARPKPSTADVPPTQSELQVGESRPRSGKARSSTSTATPSPTLSELAVGESRPRPTRSRPSTLVETNAPGKVDLPSRPAGVPSVTKVLPWPILAVIGCVVLWTISQSGSAASVVMVFLVMLGVGWFILRAANQTGRKTTTMPWDTTAKRKGRRLP